MISHYNFNILLQLLHSYLYVFVQCEENLVSLEELKDSELRVVAIHPGLVSSDMGKYGFEQLKKKTNIDVSAFPSTTPESSASQIVQTVISLDKSTGVEFVTYNGSQTPW